MALDTHAEVARLPGPRFGSSFLERFADVGGKLAEARLYEDLAGLSDSHLGAVFVAAVEVLPDQARPAPEVARVLQMVIQAARARFQRYARGLSRKYCIRLYHRSNARECDDKCVTVATFDGPILDRIVGSEEPVKRRDGTQRHKLGYFFEWASSGFRMHGKPTGEIVSFNVHLNRRSHRGWSDEVLRAWNDERGLVQYLRVGGAPARQLTAGLQEVLSDQPLLARVAEPFEWPRANELREPESADTWAAAWLTALYADACQTPVPGRMVDVLRVARHLDGKRWRVDKLPRGQQVGGLAYRLLLDHDANAAWQETVARVDAMMRDRIPDTYERLQAARTLTQASVGSNVGDDGGTQDHDDAGGRPVNVVDQGPAASDVALDRVAWEELDRLLSSSPEADELRGAGFAIGGFNELLVALESARTEIGADESIEASLGRVLRPGKAPSGQETRLLGALVSRVISIVQGEDLP